MSGSIMTTVPDSANGLPAVSLAVRTWVEEQPASRASAAISSTAAKQPRDVRFIDLGRRVGRCGCANI